jgi:membrane fusion protein, multidrug efflux system
MSVPAAKGLLLGLIALAIAGGAFWYLDERDKQSTDDASLNGRTVSISPKISGYVKILNINDNQAVKAGDVLLEIEPTDYRIRRDRAQANLLAAQAAAQVAQQNMETTDVSAPSNRAVAQAQLEAAKANWLVTQQALQRLQRLSDQSRSQSQLDQAVASEQSAKSAYFEADTAPKVIAAAKAQARQSQAQLQQAEADLAQAETDLANTRIIAPISGRITNRSVERGNYLQPGQQLATLVSDEIWVVANFKETQLAHMRPGQPVEIGIDAYPDQHFHGKVDSIQAGTGAFFSAFPPQNATGNFVKIVQRVPVKIVFDPAPDAALSLGPGMSVEPVVDTAQAR